MSEPLQPFSPSPALASFLPGGLSAGSLVMWALYALLAFWAVYTIITIYHWLKYSHASTMTFPAIALHLAISISLISYILSGNGIFLAPYLP